MNVICGSAVKMKRGHPWRDVWRRRGEQVVVLGSRGAVKVPPRHSKKKLPGKVVISSRLHLSKEVNGLAYAFCDYHLTTYQDHKATINR